MTSSSGCHRLLRNMVRAMQNDRAVHRGVVQVSWKCRFPEGNLMASLVFCITCVASNSRLSFRFIINRLLVWSNFVVVLEIFGELYDLDISPTHLASRRLVRVCGRPEMSNKMLFFYFQIDVDEAEDAAQEYAVSAMPTFLFIKNSQKVHVRSLKPQDLILSILGLLILASQCYVWLELSFSVADKGEGGYQLKLIS